MSLRILLMFFIVGGTFAFGGAKNKISLTVYEFELDGTTCVTKGVSENKVKELRGIIASVSESDLNKWVSKHVQYDGYFKHPARHAKLRLLLDDLDPPAYDGFTFLVDGGRLHYEERERWLLDGYTYPMTFFNASGWKKWRRKSPMMRTPAIPIINQGYIAYISGSDLFLIVLNARNGKLLAKYPIGFSRHKPGSFSVISSSILPYWSKGHIVLCLKEIYDCSPSPGWKPGGILVFEIQQ